MDCVNHTGTSATAFCQNCGKAICTDCVRNAAGGQVLCEPCWTAWQGFQQPFAPAPTAGPNPIAAAILGVIPGVGAMYNGQFFKGLIHVVVFAFLISLTDHNGIFGIFIAAWVVYQSFEAFHTAKARRDGQPLPDPFGLNQVGEWLSGAARGQMAGPAQGQGPASTTQGQGAQGGYQAPYQNPYQGSNQPPYPNPYAPPGAGFPVPGMPPAPLPPNSWRRREPVGAIVLIALGVLFLLGQFDLFSSRVFDFAWPLMLIALGVWLVIRRLGATQGGCK